jgi:hypothetical protein
MTPRSPVVAPGRIHYDRGHARHACRIEVDAPVDEDRMLSVDGDRAREGGPAPDGAAGVTGVPRHS